MPLTLAPAILTALTIERDALRVFVSLLEQEQRDLIENVTDDLPALAEQKSAQAIKLTGLISTRQHLLGQQLPVLNTLTLNTWLSSQQPSAQPLWLELQNLAQRAQQLNQSSGELIQLKLRHNQQALLVLNQASRTANLYGADGHPSFTPHSGRPLASV
jgi:flagella synthesis protein FlgN